jgi:hypothetical protein
MGAIENYTTALSLFNQSDNPKHWCNEAIKDLNQLIATHKTVDGANDILDLVKKTCGETR